MNYYLCTNFEKKIYLMTRKKNFIYYVYFPFKNNKKKHKVIK